MEWESDSPCCSHTSPRWPSGWELEFRDCGTIPGWGLLLTVDRQIEGMGGRRLWWEMPVEESRAAMQARRYCWVTSRRWSHHHSLSPPTCQRWQLDNREAGPSNAWPTELQSRTTQGAPLSDWCTDPQSRTPPRGAPSMCLRQRTTEKDPRQGSRLSAWMGGIMEKDWPKRPSDLQLQGAQKKKNDTAWLRQRQSVSLHTWRCRGLYKLSNCATFILNSHWGKLPQAKKVLRLWVQGLLCSVRLCNPVDRDLSGREVLQARILEHTGHTGCHTLLEYYISWCLSRNSPEYLVLPEPLRPKQLHFLHTWPSQGLSQVLQGSLRSKPQWTTHMQRWKENHIETQGQCG